MRAKWVVLWREKHSKAPTTLECAAGGVKMSITFQKNGWRLYIDGIISDSHMDATNLEAAKLEAVDRALRIYEAIIDDLR